MGSDVGAYSVTKQSQSRLSKPSICCIYVEIVTVCNSLNKVLDMTKHCVIVHTWLAHCWSVTRKSTMFTKEKIEDIIVTILCLAVFAGWGVLLALGV